MGGTPRLLWGGALACAVSLGMGRFAFTPLLPLMQNQYALSAENGAWLAAANNVGYLLGALWAGLAETDRQRHRLLGLGLAALPITLAAMATTDQMGLWLSWRFLCGTAAALVFVLAAALVVPLLTEAGHAHWSGAHFCGVGLGIAAAGGLLAFTGPGLGADGGWLASAALTLGMASWAWIILASAHHRPPPSVTARPPLPPAVSGRRLIPIGAAYFCEGLGYIVTGTFLVTMARSSPLLAPVADLSWILVGVAAAPSTIAWAWLAEHRGHRFALISAHAIQTVGIALPALWAHPAAVMIGAVMFGGTFLGIAGLAMAYGRVLAPERPARTMGLLTALFSLGQVLGPPLGAWLAGWGGWSTALLMAAGVVAAGIPLLLLPSGSHRNAAAPYPGHSAAG